MSSVAMFFLSPLLPWITVTGVLGAACIAIWFLAPAWLPINRSHFLWAGIALLGCGAFYWYAFHAGERHMAQMVAAKDRAAIERVSGALQKLGACEHRGGEWNVETGSCDR